MVTVYEWVVEEWDDYGDVADCNFFGTYAEAQTFKFQYLGNLPCEIALVKAKSNKKGDSVDSITYAYVKRGKLADQFEDGSVVPTKYKDMVK